MVQSVDSLNSLVLAGVRRRKVDPLVCLIGYFALTSGEGFNAVLIRHDLAGLSKLEDLLQGQLPMLMPGSRYLKAKRTWRLIHMDVRWTGFSGQAPSLTSEAGTAPVGGSQQ